MYEDVDCKYNKFWVPLMWANSVLVTARKEGLIQNEWGLRMIIEVCNLPILIMFFINRLCFLNLYYSLIQECNLRVDLNPVGFLVYGFPIFGI
jgi:hypothetical protein